MAFGEEPRFSFHHLPGRSFAFLEDRDTKDLLQKWSLLGGMKAAAFGYDQHFQTYNKDGFFKDFFSTPAVGSALQVVGSGRSWRSIGCHGSAKVDAESVPCQVLSMDFFDRLTECGVIRSSGDIRKCFDEYVEDFMISDELRKVLLMEDFEHFGIFSGDDRTEFLFRIFSHICLGGSVCQFEDAITAYLTVSRLIYKTLVSVVKETPTNKLKVASYVFKLSLSENGANLFPSSSEHVQSFAYAVIDPVKRQVTVWWHDWNFGF